MRKYFCVEIKFPGRHLTTSSLKINWRSKEPEPVFHIACSATWCGREGSTQHTATRKEVVGLGVVSSKVCTIDHEPLLFIVYSNRVFVSALLSEVRPSCLIFQMAGISGLYCHAKSKHLLSQRRNAQVQVRWDTSAQKGTWISALILY